MRVTLVCPYSWAFPGGVLEHVDALADHLERRGHVAAVISPNDPLDFRTRLLHPKLGRHGALPARVTPVGRSLPLPSNGSLGNLAFSPAMPGKVRRAIKRNRPDVVHVHEPLLPPLGWAAVRAARDGGVPVVGTFHSHYPDGCGHYKTWRLALEPIIGSLHTRVAVSPAAAKTAAEYFPGGYRIVPNGVDVERFRPPEGNEPRRKPADVLFVGRAARKGLPVLLRALPKLTKRVPEARLLVAGSHPEDLQPYRKLLPPNTKVLGVLDEEGLVRAMHSAAVLCAPSTGAESFGIVLIEALAAGLPVVASDIPGYDAVINPGQDGVLFPPGDPQALADALSGALLNPERRTRLAETGLATVRRYDWSRIAAEIEGIYLEAMGARST